MSQDILKRLQEATGPDRELDAHILCAIHGYTMHEDSNPSTGIFAFWENGICHNCSSWDKPTSSVDAALALVERMLPGWACGFDRGPKTIIAFVDRHDFSDRLFGAKYTAEAKTAPLAILSALFGAAEEEGKA